MMRVRKAKPLTVKKVNADFIQIYRDHDSLVISIEGLEELIYVKKKDAPLLAEGITDVHSDICANEYDEDLVEPFVIS